MHIVTLVSSVVGERNIFRRRIFKYIVSVNEIAVVLQQWNSFQVGGHDSFITVQFFLEVLQYFFSEVLQLLLSRIILRVGIRDWSY